MPALLELPDLPRGFVAVELGHVDVHEDVGNWLKRLCSVGGGRLGVLDGGHVWRQRGLRAGGLIGVDGELAVVSAEVRELVLGGVCDEELEVDGVIVDKQEMCAAAGRRR